MKFRKKPVVIEAWQWNPEHADFPIWFSLAFANKTLSMDGVDLHIETLEGRMTAYVGDWIIQGIKGELYPCKPDIFEATYEKVA